VLPQIVLLVIVLAASFSKPAPITAEFSEIVLLITNNRAPIAFAFKIPPPLEPAVFFAMTQLLIVNTLWL
jgi:hypothetical protein